MMKKSAFAILITLLVIMLLIIIVFSIAIVNQISLNLSLSMINSKKALLAAQAGVAKAVYELYDNSNWNAGFATT